MLQNAPERQIVHPIQELKTLIYRMFLFVSGGNVATLHSKLLPAVVNEVSRAVVVAVSCPLHCRGCRLIEYDHLSVRI